MHEASKKDAQRLKRRIMMTLDDLPPMPEVVMRAQKVMADPDSNIEDLVVIIETDQSIAVRILKLINSAYYNMSGKVSSIRQACNLLGLRTLREVIITAGVSEVLGRKMKGYGFESGELWRHSIATGFCSRILAERKDPEFMDDAYVGGLLHDAGKIILDPYVLELKDAFRGFMKDESKTVLQAEKRILGFDHAEIASDICRKWNIPENIIPAIQYHHYPSRSAGNELAYIIHAADYLVRLSGLGYEDDDVICELEEGADEFLSLTQEDISATTFQVFEFVQTLGSAHG